MPTQIQFDWLNNGEPTDFEDIPMAGDDELDRLTKKYAKSISLQKKSVLLHRFNIIVSVKNVLDMGHVEKARKAWQEGLPMIEQNVADFDYPLETFLVDFNAYFHTEIELRYDVSGFEEANTFFRARMKEFEAETKDVDLVSVKEFQKERFVADIYWRFKRAYPTILVDGVETAISRESLRQVIRIPGDWNTYLTALAEANGERSAEEREVRLEEVTEEGIKKKSLSTPRSSKQSKTASLTTSETGTARVTP